jgi:TRAP-type C4-dicarboxylate transport system permease small subunit
MVLIKLVRGMSRILSFFAWLSILYLMLSISLDVVQRNLSVGLVNGLVEYNEVVLVGMTYTALAYAQQTDSHVATDMVARFLPARVAAALHAAGLVIVVLVLLWMVTRTWASAMDSLASREFRFGLARVPIYPARFALPIGLLALAFEIMVDIFESGRLALGAESADDRPSGQSQVIKL